MATAISKKSIIVTISKKPVQNGLRTTSKWLLLAAGLVGSALGGFGGDAYSENAPASVITAARERATEAYQETRKRYQIANATPEAAWQFARACFDEADLATSNAERARLAQEGITAAQKAIDVDPKLGAAYYYRGLNQGQLARTKKLSALGLLDDIEQSWTQAMALSPDFDYAGPHRSLGILYRDAPGWPLSLGSRTKARQHLEKAVKLAPTYPDNVISLLESYLEWGDRQAVQTRMDAATKVLATARTVFTGKAWELSWYDWNHRWAAIQAKAAVNPPKTLKSPRERD